MTLLGRAGLGVAAVALLGTIAAACGAADQAEGDVERQLTEALDPEGDGDVTVDVDPDSGIVSVETADGVFVRGAGQERPEWLPADIPLPDDLTIELSSVLGNIAHIVGTTPTDAGRLRSIYLDAARAADWRVDPDGEQIADEEIIVLAYTTDGTPLDIRLDGGNFDLFYGRRWEPLG